MGKTRRPFEYEKLQHAVQACRRSKVKLTEWEKRFLRESGEFNWPSAKQRETLGFICKKCRVPWPDRGAGQ